MEQQARFLRKALTGASGSATIAPATMDVQGLASAIIELTGTFVGTVIFEYTINGTDWYTLTANIVGSSTTATGATAVGKWAVNVSGFQAIRVRCTAFTSGSINVLIRAIQSGSAAASSGGGGAATIADGADANAGTTTDAAVTTDANGTLSAKLRGIVKILNDVWNSTSHFFSVSLSTLIAGEDLTNNVLKTEQRFSYSPVAAADVQVKGSAGFLHTVTFSCNDAAPTAGSIIIYDSLSETGTQVFNHTFTTTPFVPFTITLDCVMGTGIYIGFTTTNDVNVSCSYR